MRLVRLTLIVFLPMHCLLSQPIPSGPVTLVSAMPGGLGPGPGTLQAPSSGKTSVSGNGSRVAWESDYPHDPMDTNSFVDIYVYDEPTGITALVSRGLSGTSAGGSLPLLSEDGMRIIFTGFPNALIPGDPGVAPTPIIADLANLGAISFRRIIVRHAGDATLWPAWAAAATPDLEYAVVLSSDQVVSPLSGAIANSAHKSTYRIRTSDLRTEKVNPDCLPTHDAESADISDDGSLVAYETRCANMGVLDNNLGTDVFVKDMTTGISWPASTISDTSGLRMNGASIWKLSGDGSRIILSVLLNRYLPQAYSLPTFGYIRHEVFGVEYQSVHTDFGGAAYLDPCGISFDGSQILVSGRLPPSSGNTHVVARSDLGGGLFEIVSRDSTGALLPYGMLTYGADWSPNGRWLSAYGWLIEAPPFPNPWTWAPVGNCIRIDLGPGQNLGGGTAGSAGVPEIRLVEGIASAWFLHMTLRNAAPSSLGLMGVGFGLSPAQLGFGTAWSWPPEFIAGFPTTSSGDLTLTLSVPPMIPPTLDLVGQFAVVDAGSPFGFSVSNGLRLR